MREQISQVARQEESERAQEADEWVRLTILACPVVVSEHSRVGESASGHGLPNTAHQTDSWESSEGERGERGTLQERALETNEANQTAIASISKLKEEKRTRINWK